MPSAAAQPRNILKAFSRKEVCKMKVWNIEAVTGYKPKTTFYEDFSIADMFGIDAIRDTYYRAFRHWNDNIEYLTELVMVLNWKMWEHFDKNRAFSQLYQDLFMESDAWAKDNLQGDDLDYYYKTID